MTGDTRAAALRKLRDATPEMVAVLLEIATRGCNPSARAEARGVLALLNQPEPDERARAGVTAHDAAEGRSEARKPQAADAARGRARLMLRSRPNDTSR